MFNKPILPGNRIGRGIITAVCLEFYWWRPQHASRWPATNLTGGLFSIAVVILSGDFTWQTSKIRALTGSTLTP